MEWLAFGMCDHTYLTHQGLRGLLLFWVIFLAMPLLMPQTKFTQKEYGDVVKVMNLVNDDLKAINFQFLMLARECARHNPMEAIWRFNLDELEIEKIASMTIEEIKSLSECGRAVFRMPSVTPAPQGITSCIAASLLPNASLAQA